MGNNQWNYVAIGNFNKNSDAEISIKKNDKLYVLDTSVQEWYVAINLRTRSKGYVPSKYVALKDSLDTKDWYFKNCTRLDAELLLEYIENISGTFLIRESETRPNKFALSILSENENNERKVNHHLIHKSQEDLFYISTDSAFPTLDELVAFYSGYSSKNKRKSMRNQVPLLTKPCRKEMDVPGVQGVWEESRENIEIGNKIGYGVSGDVFRGVWRKTYPVAIKVVKNSEKPHVRESMLNEANKIKELKHKHIVKLWCVCTISDPIIIVTELMDNGSLLDYLKNDKGRKIHIKHIIIFALHIASGMKYLASKKYVHRDLAARNVLVNERNIAKVSDFGLTQKVNENNVVEVIADEANRIPFKWTAPESIKADKNNKRYYGLKSDVWSYGIVLYELITYGSAPYPNMQPVEVYSKVVVENYRMPKPDGICSDSYYEIMLKCWHEDPDSRPDFNHLYNTFEAYSINTEGQYGN